MTFHVQTRDEICRLTYAQNIKLFFLLLTNSQKKFSKLFLPFLHKKKMPFLKEKIVNTKIGNIIRNKIVIIFLDENICIETPRTSADLPKIYLVQFFLTRNFFNTFFKTKFSYNKKKSQQKSTKYEKKRKRFEKQFFFGKIDS